MSDVLPTIDALYGGTAEPEHRWLKQLATIADGTGVGYVREMLDFLGSFENISTAVFLDVGRRRAYRFVHARDFHRPVIAVISAVEYPDVRKCREQLERLNLFKPWPRDQHRETNRGQTPGKRNCGHPLPRGRLQGWPSLNERRMGWGTQ